MASGALLVGLELNLVQGRDDLFTDEFDGAHHVFIRHVALVSVTDQVTRCDSVQDFRQLFDDGVWTADDDEIGRAAWRERV